MERFLLWGLIVATSVTMRVLSFSDEVLPLMSLLPRSSVSSMGNFEINSGGGRCGGRLERALDALQQRDSQRRKNRLDDEKDSEGSVYHEKLISAPLDITVSRIAVKLPDDSRNNHGNEMWARVERCNFERKNNALETRIMFNDLSVAGIISVLPRDNRLPIQRESCRMSLRLRRAGIEFYTSPIARGRRQMRIRTESSFLEPRFASIYAYGCKPSRVDKQIKRHDKHHPPHRYEYEDRYVSTTLSTVEEPAPYYEAPEPRDFTSRTIKEQDIIAVTNESWKLQDGVDAAGSDGNLGIWRKNVWVTKIPRIRDRRGNYERVMMNHSKAENASMKISRPMNLILALAGRAIKPISESERKRREDRVTANSSKKEAIPSSLIKDSNKVESPKKRAIFDHEDSEDEALTVNYSDRYDDSHRGTIPISSKEITSREISNEVEDVFLRGASQALTRYIERELHPAIKETLMLSMGYTISYG